MELFEIVEKAQEDYNIPGTYICEKNGDNDRFICEVNDEITIEFRNNHIVNKLKKKKYKYALDVSYGKFGRGQMFNEYEEIKDTLDSVKEIQN